MTCIFYVEADLGKKIKALEALSFLLVPKAGSIKDDFYLEMDFSMKNKLFSIKAASEITKNMC